MLNFVKAISEQLLVPDDYNNYAEWAIYMADRLLGDESFKPKVLGRRSALLASSIVKKEFP